MPHVFKYIFAMLETGQQQVSCKRLLIELKAAIKGGVNQTSKQWVSGGTHSWLKTEHVLTQKSWTSSHFSPSQEYFFTFWKFLPATNREEEPRLHRGGETCQPLPALQGGQQADPGPVTVSATGLRTLWNIPWWRTPGQQWHHSFVQGPYT